MTHSPLKLERPLIIFEKKSTEYVSVAKAFKLSLQRRGVRIINKEVEKARLNDFSVRLVSQVNAAVKLKHPTSIDPKKTYVRRDFVEEVLLKQSPKCGHSIFQKPTEPITKADSRATTLAAIGKVLPKRSLPTWRPRHGR